MKKVLFITNYYPKFPTLTSFGTWALDQTKAIATENKTLVISFVPYLPKFLLKINQKFEKWINVYNEHEINENLKIKYTRINPLIYKNIKKLKKIPFIGAFFLYLKIKKTIKEFKPDIIIANHVLIEGAIAYIISKKLNIPYICFEHSPDDFYPVNKRHFKAYKEVVEKSKAFINVSNYSFEKINKIYNFSDKNKIILYNYSQDAKKYKDKLNLSRFIFDNKKKYIIEVANFEHRKNHILILKIFNEIKDMFPDWQIVFVGSHHQTLPLINDFIEKNKLNSLIHIIKDMKHTDVLNLLNFMNIFVLPSNSEMFSVSLLEALSAELPMIGTKYNGLVDDIFKKYDLINLDPEDVDQIKNTLIKLMNDENLRNKLGIGNRKLYEEFFMDIHYQKNINEIIKNIIRS